MSKRLSLCAVAAAAVLAMGSSGAMAFDASDCTASYGAVPGSGGHWEASQGETVVNNGGQGHASVICTAYNKAGNVKTDADGNPIAFTTVTDVKVCGSGKDADGNPYPACS